jgi:hypothetical protein
MTSGIWNIGGGAYDPATPPELLNRTRRTINQPLNPWLEERERLLGPYRLPLHTQPDIHDKYRVKATASATASTAPSNRSTPDPAATSTPTRPTTAIACPSAKARPSNSTATTSSSPRPRARATSPPTSHCPTAPTKHAAIYHAWRSRTEGLLGTLTEHHGMWGGRHGFKVRNFDILQLFAIAAGIAYNLRRQGHFAPDHGTDDCNDESVLIVPEPHARALARTLAARQRVRDTFDPTTCTTHDHPTPPTTSPRNPPPTRPPASPDPRPCAVGQHPYPPARQLARRPPRRAIPMPATGPGHPTQPIPTPTTTNSAPKDAHADNSVPALPLPDGDLGKGRKWARGDLNPHVHKDTRT